MRKLLAALLAAGMVISCAGCGASDNTEGDKLSVITTIYPAYDFARQVFGDTAEVTLLLKPGTESHTYDPSAKDIVNISSCDLFIYNGGESDQWVSSILEGTEDITTLRMMDTVAGLSEEHDHEEHSDNDHSETVYDEHIWTSPANAARIVSAIEEAACAVSHENAEAYSLAAGEYITQINDLDLRFTELLAEEERTFVFGDRFPLLYFFEEYALKHHSAFPGCGSNVEPSAQVISELLAELSGEDAVPAVFKIELSNGQLADTLAEDTGLQVYEFHTCHNITAEDFAAGETYVSLMERNYAMLTEILS